MLSDLGRALGCGAAGAPGSPGNGALVWWRWNFLLCISCQDRKQQSMTTRKGMHVLFKITIVTVIVLLTASLADFACAYFRTPAIVSRFENSNLHLSMMAMILAPSNTTYRLTHRRIISGYSESRTSWRARANPQALLIPNMPGVLLDPGS